MSADISTWAVVPIPLITGFVCSGIWGMGSNSGENVAARPPPVVFSIIWPILYLSIGLAWAIDSKSTGGDKQFESNIMFSLLCIALCSWFPAYSRRADLTYYRISIYILLLIATYVAICILVTNRRNAYSGILLLPLFVWVQFATLLSCVDIQIYAGQAVGSGVGASSA